jgi:hypothetical protein
MYNVSESTISEQVKYKLSHLCSSIDMQGSLDLAYEYWTLISFPFSFAKMKCTYQGKTHCSTQESLRSSYDIEVNFDRLDICSLTLQENKKKGFRFNLSIRISTYLVLEIVLDQYLNNDTYA